MPPTTALGRILVAQRFAWPNHLVGLLFITTSLGNMVSPEYVLSHQLHTDDLTLVACQLFCELRNVGPNCPLHIRIDSDKLIH